MPELPEVQTVVDSIAPRLVGCALRQVRHCRLDIIRPRGFELPAAIAGRRVAAVRRRGKRIVISLDSGACFYIHLGMTGQLRVEPADAPLPPHTHLIIDLTIGRSSSQQLRFRDPRRFGGVFWLGSEQEADTMGPEPLTMRPGDLAQRLGCTARPIKNALMDQRVIAGLGNIYVDESLFAAFIHPLTPSSALTRAQVATLCRSIKRTLRTAIRHRGSSVRDYVDADGAKGGFQRLHRVYGRTGSPCQTCGTPIQRLILAGRSTHFCPRCQPAPA